MVAAYFKMDGILPRIDLGEHTERSQGQQLGPNHSPAHVTEVILRPVNYFKKTEEIELGGFNYDRF